MLDFASHLRRGRRQVIQRVEEWTSALSIFWQQPVPLSPCRHSARRSGPVNGQERRISNIWDFQYRLIQIRLRLTDKDLTGTTMVLKWFMNRRPLVAD